VVVIADQVAARIADRNIRSTISFDNEIIKILPGMATLTKSSITQCVTEQVYLIYLYQICFQPYTSGNSRDQDGYHLVYHKPKLKLSFIMPANSPDDFYFKEMAQGEYLLFVRRDGSITYGDSR